MLRWQTFLIYYLPRYTRLEQNNTQISDVEQFLAKYDITQWYGRLMSVEFCHYREYKYLYIADKHRVLMLFLLIIASRKCTNLYDK